MSRSRSVSPLPNPKLPTGWNNRRLKYVSLVQVSNVDKKSVDGEESVQLCNYVDVYKNEHITPALEFMDATATASQIQNFGLKRGDVLITKDSEAWDDIAVPAVVTDDLPGVLCGYHLAHIRPNPNVLDGRYLSRCFAASGIREQFHLGANGITRFGLGKDEITGASFPIPPLAIQQHIAEYLDRETSRIDELIAAKEWLLQLLAEKRQALIAHAVTRGLDPDVTLRGSGIPWLGEIPASWTLLRGKYLWREDRLAVEEEDEIVTCFRDGQVTLRRNRREEGFTTAVKEVGYQGVRKGQLVVHSMDAFAGAIGVSDSDGKCTPEYIICEPVHDSVYNPYFGLLLREMALRGYIQAYCSAVRERAPRIHFTDIGEMFFPLPPKAEQVEIIAYIEQSEHEANQLATAATHSVELLRERRSAVIAAAVTGQLEVEG
ncbi:MAG: restriction endonuclease subunit S [Planctomycetaceae bacterium]|nr:restriction endonuclease subunit S [Planctomycetaceae bacterium]